MACDHDRFDCVSYITDETKLTYEISTLVSCYLSTRDRTNSGCHAYLTHILTIPFRSLSAGRDELTGNP